MPVILIGHINKEGTLAGLFAKDRKSFYILAAIALLTLLSGVTINSMETTQMSWFMMLFAGMVVSADEEAASRI